MLKLTIFDRYFAIFKRHIGDLYGAADLLLLCALIASAIERRTDEQTDVVTF